MATITKTPADTWKILVRRRGFPTAIKTFPKKRDAEAWARETESAMVSMWYVSQEGGAKLLLSVALGRYLREVTTAKAWGTQGAEKTCARHLIEHLGTTTMLAINQDVVAGYRDKRIEEGSSANTVRLELALLSHLFTVALQEWRLGLTYNPVTLVRKPSAGRGRNRRLEGNEEERLFIALDAHSNPMLSWFSRLALETAMRRTEILTVTHDQVDWAKKIIHLTKTKMTKMIEDLIAFQSIIVLQGVQDVTT